MINILRNYLYNKNNAKLLVKVKDINILKLKQKKSKKIFYIIKRNKWRGMFSNLHYVISHLIYAKKKKFTCLVDMENYPTIYNETNKINNSFNSWDYYFENLNSINLNKVYKNFNFIFSDSTKLDTSKLHKRIYMKYEKILHSNLIKKKIIYQANLIEKKFFKDNKVLGVHLRGSDQKKGTLHPFPPTLKQTMALTEKTFKKYKFDKIFLVTEEKNYFNKFKNKFGKKLINFDTYRSDDDIFLEYPRKNHRYLLGHETIINMILMSKANHLIHSNTNFSAMSVVYSRKKLKQTIIFNGYNSKNIFIASILWYLKSLLPYNFGGFENKIKTTSKLEAL